MLSSIILIAATTVLITLTKLPSVFALALILLILFPEIVNRLIGQSPFTQFIKLFILIVSGPIVLLTIWIFGNYVDGRIRLTTMNPGLGQLASAGRSFVGPTLVLNQLWFWIFVGVLLWQKFRSRSNESSGSSWLIATSAVSLLCALTLEMSLSGATNTYTYFSGPFYFLASLSFLVAGAQIHSILVLSRVHLVLTGLFVTSGLVWILTDISSPFWNLVARLVDIDNPTRTELLKFFTSDGRFGATLLAATFLVCSFRSSRVTSWISASLLIALIVITLYELGSEFQNSFRAEVSLNEITSNLGSDSQREIGTWLHNHTRTDEMVGTNFLSEETAGSVSDYAFAVWSKREFFVLGPQLGYGTTPARSEAFNLSRSFAAKPSDRNCAQLSRSGVRWFVIDERLTPNRDWSRCAEQVYRAEDFVILKLGDHR
jgi:hypothetical protein